MNIYIYDEKYERILGEYPIKPSDTWTFADFINFLNDNGLSSRYAKLVIAETYRIGYSEEEPFIEFEGVFE